MNQITHPGKILVVDDHAAARESVVDTLSCCGHEVHSCGSAREALSVLDNTSCDVLITDLRMPGMTGMQLMREVRQRDGEIQMVMVTAHASIDSAVEAMRHGAFDYIEKPFRADQLENLVARALNHGPTPRASVDTGDSCAMIGSSTAMQTLRERIGQVAATSETVLITGESGVGKELVARAIHENSDRHEKPLISLNCPALSPQLMESELFGHERGAFTNAESTRVGRFELAEGGTIFLDEVTEISLPLQAKLLRVLQERTYERVGSNATCHADVRVLASSNRDLREAVDEGSFREDLFFRLAVVPIPVPPLRERREDVTELVQHFLAATSQRIDQPARRLDGSAAQLLADYHWPGNVRELENIVTRACVLATGDTITSDDLSPWLLDQPTDEATENVEQAIPVGMKLHEMERTLIEATLAHFDGHRAHTAQALGIGVRTLANKLRSYGYAPREKAFARSA